MSRIHDKKERKKQSGSGEFEEFQLQQPYEAVTIFESVYI